MSSTDSFAAQRRLALGDVCYDIWALDAVPGAGLPFSPAAPGKPAAS